MIKELLACSGLLLLWPRLGILPLASASESAQQLLWYHLSHVLLICRGTQYWNTFLCCACSYSEELLLRLVHGLRTFESWTKVILVILIKHVHNHTPIQLQQK
jgi:hypothetical protein